MNEALPTGSSAATDATEPALQQLAAAPLTSLSQARELLAKLLTQQRALLLEHQQLHAARQELATSEARLQAAEAVAGIGSYELDLASGALHFSAGLCRLLGEVPGSFQPSLDWLDARSNPDDAQTVRRVLDQAIRHQQPYHYRRRIRRADGAWRVLESHGQVVSSPDGAALRLEGVVEDKTDQQRAANALRTATQRLQATFDSSLDMVQVFEAVRDEQGELLDFRWTLDNRVSERIYGDVIGQRLLERNPGVVETGIFDTFKQVVATGVPDQSERHYTSEQFNGWFYQSTVKLGDGVVVTTADISALKRNEQEVLRLQQEIAQRAVDKYHALFNSLDAGLCVLDLQYDAAGAASDGICREANPAFERQTGCRQPVGQRLSQWQPDLGRGWLARLAQVARTGTATRFTQPVPALGCWLEVHAFSTGTADSRQVALLYTDVSEQKRQAQRQQFRLHLSDALRPLGDAVAIQQVASALTQTFFEADRCYYGEIADGQCVIRRDASATGVSSVAGQYDLRAMPLFGAALAAGQPLVVEDVQTTALVDDAFRQLCRQLQVVSFINVPVRKNGQAVGIFCLTQGTPRRWAPEEVALVVEVAERTWGAVKRARAEEHLHESEERFRQLVEAYAQAVWEADPRGLIVQDSPSWRAYTGQTEAEWLGDGWLDAIHPDDRAYAERQWHEAIATGRNVDTEFRLRRAAGGYCWTNVRATPLSDTAGRVHKWVGMNIDIDQQKRASDHLRRSQERLRLALEAAELATWDWNLTTNQVRWNARHFTLFGMVPSPKPVTPADFERHVHPGDRVAVLARLQAAAAANTVFEAEFRIITDQGDTRWMSGHGQPTSTAPDGRIRWMSGVMLDITARKHTEQQQLDLAAALERKVARRTQALQASKDLQEAVLNTVRHAITVLTAVRDARGQIIDFAFLLSNGVADRHMGVATAGRTLRTVLPGYADEANFRLMVQVVETGQPTDAVQHFAHGAHPLHLHTQYNKLGDGVVLVHEDITARLAAEQAIQDSRDLLQSVYDTSLIGMAVLHAERDAHGTIEDFTFVSVNQELARATGRPDLVGRRYAREFPGSVPSGSLALMARAVETGAPQQHEHYYPYEGINRWYASMYVQLDGGVVAITLDITERKQAEQALRNNLELLEQAEQVAQLGSWAYDLATGVLRWSEGMYRLFGLPPGAPVQPGIYLAYAVAADRPVAERLVRALTDARADFAETLRLQVGPEEKTVRIKAVVQRDADGQPARVLGVDLDISQVQRLEADKLRQQQALFEAVQVAEEAERRRMSESLHNGIGQILYATKLQLDLLPDRPASAPRQQAVRLLGEAIRQTRALSHELTPATLEEFGLEKTLQSICATLNTPGLRWHCHLVLEPATTLPMPLQLAVYRLAQELAQNVLKHAQATEATLEVEELPGWVVLRVEDNGRGFDPSRTSDGLGLRSLRGRVALLGGQVYLTTAPGEGTQFQLHIPLAS